MTKSYMRYWGKAKPAEGEANPYHLLAYHSLDVAAVAQCWLESSSVVQAKFWESNSSLSLEQSNAVILFFVALHDIGKLDTRFQCKAPEAYAALFTNLPFPPKHVSRGYFHGPEGWKWLMHCADERIYSVAENLAPWLAAVCGHHGAIPFDMGDPPYIELPADILEADNRAKLEWLVALEQLLLIPVGLQVEDIPPKTNEILAGFCSVVDWLGSDEHFFPYETDPVNSLQELGAYFDCRSENAKRVLEASGLLGQPCREGGMQEIFPDRVPRQVQELVGHFNCKSGLTLIEAPTGSGKTEAALAFAARLLSEGKAESIIFALPTQATSNAMFNRLEEAAPRLFPGGSNTVLAHGKARFHSGYQALKKRGYQATVQGSEDAATHCVSWLSNSRKRLFLGQIGVCTIDQVLLSALPVKHNFVRGFGLGKSVLIVDEVHAYDSYMNGLLDAVLKQQSQMGASAILLSATLPETEKARLIKAWNPSIQAGVSPAKDYPLVTQVREGSQQPRTHTLGPRTYAAIPKREVELTSYKTIDASPDLAILEEMVAAAQSGAKVCLICNLVDIAQATYTRLLEISDVPIDLFHARFRFKDRDVIERQVLDAYGDGEHRSIGGRILVATQVVEQSLDLDFDWMLTQICPVDLLIQRLGRLHRHERQRPLGYEAPKCTVLGPLTEDYGLHELIYGNARVLWRTQIKVDCSPWIFPDQYRELVDSVYDSDPWPGENESLTDGFDRFWAERRASAQQAKRMTLTNINPFADSDTVINALTRDSEMSLSVVPCCIDNGKRVLVDNAAIAFGNMDEFQRDEALNLNCVNVPQSWGKCLPKADEDGWIWLPLEKQADVFSNADYQYSTSRGLQRLSNPNENT